MNSLICPVSPNTIDKNASRIGATMTAIVLVAYAISGFWPILLLVVADYVVRVFTPYKAPSGWIAGWLARAAKLTPAPMNAGPKIFAWRLGFITAVVSLVLVPISPTASVIVAALLAALNALDGVFNLCVGCVIYTYIVLPYHNRTSVPESAS